MNSACLPPCKVIKHFKSKQIWRVLSNWCNPSGDNKGRAQLQTDEWGGNTTALLESYSERIESEKYGKEKTTLHRSWPRELSINLESLNSSITICGNCKIGNSRSDMAMFTMQNVCGSFHTFPFCKQLYRWKCFQETTEKERGSLRLSQSSMAAPLGLYHSELRSDLWTSIKMSRNFFRCFIVFHYI